MTDMIMNSDILPEPLLSLVHTRKIRVRESDGVISISPIDENGEALAKVRGCCADGRLTSEKFMAWKRAEKELEL